MSLARTFCLLSALALPCEAVLARPKPGDAANVLERLGRQDTRALVPQRVIVARVAIQQVKRRPGDYWSAVVPLVPQSVTTGESHAMLWAQLPNAPTFRLKSDPSTPAANPMAPLAAGVAPGATAPHNPSESQEVTAPEPDALHSDGANRRSDRASDPVASTSLSGLVSLFTGYHLAALLVAAPLLMAAVWRYFGLPDMRPNVLGSFAIPDQGKEVNISSLPVVAAPHNGAVMTPRRRHELVV